MLPKWLGTPPSAPKSSCACNPNASKKQITSDQRSKNEHERRRSQSNPRPENDEIESQIEKLQEKRDQALADPIENQEKMMADAEAFWQASNEFIDAYAQVSDARSKIFDEDETTAKQEEKELEKAQEKMDQAERKAKIAEKKTMKPLKSPRKLPKNSTN